MDAMVYHWIESALLGLYPPVCLLCGADGQPGRDLCGGCRDDLPINGSPCRLCAEPLPAGARPGSICGSCLRHPPPFASCHAPFLYEPPIDWLVGRLKFHGRLAAGRVLAGLLGDALEPVSDPRPDLILPMPLHPSRLRTRGFNQATEIARPVARRLGVPLVTDLARRIRPGAPQSRLAKALRQANVRGAFVVRAPLAGEQIALIDDVITTGATAAELARTLLRAGASRVDVWAVARTSHDHEPSAFGAGSRS
jgi:ComF family protein